MLGACSGLPASNSITVNEVTTIGSVWPLAAFMTSSSAIGSAPNDTSFLNAVASVPEFINLAQGSSPGKPASTSYFAENSKLYSLSDLLAHCVNSTGGSAGDSSPCGLLFSMATPPGGTAPTDTMAAAMRIAQNPTTMSPRFSDWPKQKPTSSGADGGSQRLDPHPNLLSSRALHFASYGDLRGSPRGGNQRFNCWKRHPLHHRRNGADKFFTDILGSALD